MSSLSPRRRARAGAIVLLAVSALVLVGVLLFALQRSDDDGLAGPGASVELPAPGASAALEAGPGEVELTSAGAEVGARAGSVKPGVRLRGPGRLEGRVLERESGAPVAGAAVELLPLPPAGVAFLGRIFRLFAGPQGLSERVTPVAVAATASDGSFRFDGVRAGTYFLDARGTYHVPEGVLRARVVASGAGGPLEVWVRAGGRVLGTVLRPDGTPARGAKLAFVPGPGDFLSTLNTGDLRLLETVADADGAFEIDGVPPGDGYEITTTGAGFAVSHLTGITVRAGEDTRVVVRARSGATVTGRVLAAREEGDPAPLAEAHLGAVPRGLRNLRVVEDILTVTHCVTGPDGSYVMSNVPPGDVDLVAIERTHLPAIGARLSLTDGFAAVADDMVLKPGAMVAGRVVDPAGAPVEGASLRFNLVDWRNFQFDFSLAPLMAQAVKGFDLPKTDADGRFLAGPIAGEAPHEVTFTKPGFVEAVLQHDPAKDTGEVVVVMHRGGAVEGVVMDGARAAPVTSFTITGTDLVDGSADAPSGANPFSGGETIEDPAGRFRLASVRPGRATLVVRAPGYLPETFEVEVVEGEVKKGVIVQLAPGGVVRGQVVDGDGEAVAGAKVVVQSTGASERARDRRRERIRGATASGGRGRGGMPGSPFAPMMQAGADGVDEIPPGFLSIAAGMGFLGDRAVTSGADGRFELVGVEPGTVRAYAFHRDYSPGASDTLTMDAEGVVEAVVVRLAQGGGIRGTVTDRFGRPVPSELVLAFSPAAFGGPGTSVAGGAYQGSTDAQGRYEILHVPPGSYFLVATRGDEDLNPAAFFGTVNFDVVSVPEGEVVEFDLVDSTAGACKVRGVITYRGEPVARGNLVATSTETESLLGVEFRAAKMLGDGRFEFAGLAPGTWQLQLDGNGPQVRTSLDVPDLPEVEVEVRLPEGAVEGRVVDDRTSQPLAGVPVSLRRTNVPQARGLLGGMIARDAGSLRRATDERGEFRFERLEEGEYELVAQSANRRRSEAEDAAGAATVYAPSDPARLKLGRDQVERDLVLRLLPALEISGRITGEGAGPVNRARVVAVRDGASGAEGVHTARTDAEGRFALDGLSPGTYRLTASADGWADGRREGIVLERGKEPGEVELALSRGVLVRVRVTQGGSPVSGARAQLLTPGGETASTGADPGRVIEGFFRGEGATDAEGRVELGRYAGGKYRLEAQRGAARAVKDVQVDGGEAEVELRIALD